MEKEEIGKGRYAVGEHQQSIDREGKLAQITRDNPNPVGKAYGFFDCKASKRDIEKELPFIRKCVKTPSQLELSLMEATENPSVSALSDPKLWAIVRDAKEAGMRYFMEATYPNATNHQTADEVAPILNQAYQSSLYQKGEQFRGEVVYKKRGRYIFRE